MKTFLATWGLGYFRPGINQVGIEFFAEEAGYTAEDIGRIRELEEGQSIDFSENGIHSIVPCLSGCLPSLLDVVY